MTAATEALWRRGLWAVASRLRIETWRRRRRCVVKSKSRLTVCPFLLYFQVWYKQTSAWMLHGMLLDQGHEYFIVHTAAPDPTSASTCAAEPDEPTDDASTSEWHHAFKISLQALPSGVSVALAETVLFVGRAVRVLRRPSAAFERHSQTLLPETAMREAAASFATLQAAPEFHRLSLERTVESVRVTVAAALWALVVERADLQVGVAVTCHTQHPPISSSPLPPLLFEFSGLSTAAVVVVR